MRHAILLCSLAALATTVAAAEIRLEVTYRSAATVYLSGGSAEGLAVGDRLTVESKGAPIAEIEVTYLAEHSASCKVLRETRPVQAGDAAVIQKADSAKPVEAQPETVLSESPVGVAAPLLPRTESASEPPPWARARGGASFVWNRLWDEKPTGFDFEQRNLRLDLALWDIAGLPLQFAARGRSRQDVRERPAGFSGTPTDERRDRLYELALRYEQRGGRFSVEAGRVGVPSLGIGYLDGANLDLRAFGALRIGGFFGNRADIEHANGFQSGRKYGGYLRLAGGGAWWPGAYDAQVFAVREMAGSDPSREYVGFQGRFGGKGLTFSQWLELDLLRGWREADDGKTTQLSNLSLAASYRFKPAVSLAASYDQRRNYRTAENRSIPETVFDTFLHQGLRGSFDYNRPNGLGASAFAGVRLADDQVRRRAYSYGGGVRHSRLPGLGLSASLDGSGFSNGFTSGYQGSVRLGRAARSVTTDLAAGLSSYSLSTATDVRRLNKWLRLSVRGELSHGFWLYGEAEYDKGDDVEGPRASVEAGYRF